MMTRFYLYFGSSVGSGKGVGVRGISVSMMKDFSISKVISRGDEVRFFCMWCESTSALFAIEEEGFVLFAVVECVDVVGHECVEEWLSWIYGFFEFFYCCWDCICFLDC